MSGSACNKFGRHTYTADDCLIELEGVFSATLRNLGTSKFLLDGDVIDCGGVFEYPSCCKPYDICDKIRFIDGVDDQGNPLIHKAKLYYLQKNDCN